MDIPSLCFSIIDLSRSVNHKFVDSHLFSVILHFDLPACIFVHSTCAVPTNATRRPETGGVIDDCELLHECLESNFGTLKTRQCS